MSFVCFGDYVFAIFDDFFENKKMRDVRTIILAAVSRRDLCYVSETKVSVLGGAHVLSGSDFLTHNFLFFAAHLVFRPHFLIFWARQIRV